MAIKQRWLNQRVIQLNLHSEPSMPTRDPALRAIRRARQQEVDRAKAARHHERQRLPDLKPPYWAVIRKFSDFHSEVVAKSKTMATADNIALGMRIRGLAVHTKHVT